MNQRALLAFILTAATVFPINDADAGEKTRSPNILWIVAENMGPDLGCYGQVKPEKP